MGKSIIFFVCVLIIDIQSVLAQNIIGVIFKSTDISKIEIGKTVITDVVVYGKEVNFRKLSICQDLMSGSSDENFKKLSRIPSSEVVFPKGNILIVFKSSYDFI